MHVFLLGKSFDFPDPEFADSHGLLAIGGDLRPERLLVAYKKGIFPWYGENEPILWWSPDPRLVLYPEELITTKRLERTIRQGKFIITIDKAFRDVITFCAQVRIESGEGTWLNMDLINSFCELYNQGYAHSVEAWNKKGELVGGLYGMAIGSIFFGESMFFKERDASKVAFVTMVRKLKPLGLKLIDCQVPTRHLMSFGARLIPRRQFLSMLRLRIKDPDVFKTFKENKKSHKKLVSICNH